MTGYRQQTGYTLIEMIIAIVILGLLGAAAGYGLQNGALAFVNTTDALHTLGKLRPASERLAREIREIRRDPLTPAVYDIATMNTTTLTFTRADGTGVTLSSAPPLVTLAYSAPTGTHTLTDTVSSLTFAYYQTDGTTLATGSGDVAFVEFELVLSQNGNTYPQRTRVALRNRS
ncbi:MAG: prepilin-type N-terminal cleavage/methylation domain-containing protein [Gammaproteobacteria bacterium]|nr:prepilin-type N-terminal cleavage/methylation domain-containing protein [Gammaproteobacteria bacterium]